MTEPVKGDLFIGEGVKLTGTINASGLIEVDDTVDGTLSAESIHITKNGIVSGNTTATNIRVAGQLMNISTAHQSLLIEPTGQVSGTISYGDLEIRKGGTIIGTINSTPTKR